MTRDLAIRARGLGKRYRRLLGWRHDSVRDALQDGVASLFAPRHTREARRRRDTFWALNDASFDIARGENVGIIGLNGAGKSTLLKLLSRITVPTAGEARVHGRLGALLEVGAGFHSELTGRENIYLYGAILGMQRSEINARFGDIVAFSEIEDFIDTPVKRFSSGMYVRLAFAVAAHLDPEILLLDEVLAVGDFAFQRKCMDFARKLQERGATTLFVSHNMSLIRSMCERVIYLKQGRIAFDGPTDAGLALYENDSKLQNLHWFSSTEAPIRVTDVTICDADGRETTAFDFGERMRVRIRYDASRGVERPDFRVGIARADEVHCMTFSTTSDGIEVSQIEGACEVELLTPPIRLVSGRYNLRLVVRERGFGDIIAAQAGGAFQVRHPKFAPEAFGVLHEEGEWRAAANDIAAAKPKRNA